MKSTEVYRALRADLTPVFKAVGFKRGNAMLSWVRQQGGRHLVVWCQVSQYGGHDYGGSKFIIDFTLSNKRIFGARQIRRQRLPKMLDEIEREEIRAIQNSVIASLRSPPAHHPALHASETVRSWYMEKFRR